MTAGTVALIFLLWAPSSSPGSMPNYSRSVLPSLQAGEEPSHIKRNPIHPDFTDARIRLEGGYNTTGSLVDSNPAATLPVKTLQGCRSYLRSKGRYYEAAAESMGHVIQDARCVMIPDGKMLAPYHGAYAIDGKEQDPFAVIENPAEQPGACLHTPLAYPEDMEEKGIEASVRLKCYVYKAPDGLWHRRDCRFSDIDGHTGSPQTDSYIAERANAIESAQEYLASACAREETDASPTGKVIAQTVDFTIGQNADNEE